MLVRAAVMGTAGLAQALRDRFQHQPGGNRHRPQQLEVRPGHHAGIDVRQQSGRVVNPLRDLREIGDGRLVTERQERLARDAVAALRLVAEREQRFVAAGAGAGLSDRDRLVDRQIRRAKIAGRARERAIAADVAAELGQRNEDLRRIGDHRPVAQIPAGARRREQCLQVIDVGQRERLLVRERRSSRGAVDDDVGARGHEGWSAHAHALLEVLLGRSAIVLRSAKRARVSARP